MSLASTRKRAALSRPAPRVKSPKLRVEQLPDRITPTVYTWKGTTINEPGGNANWSNLSNWEWNLPGPVGEVPGADDDVIFSAAAPVGKRMSIVNQEFTINTLTIQDMPDQDAEYTLTLQADLSVDGDGPSLFANGTVGNDIGASASLTFESSDYAEFHWTGGTIGATTVNVMQDVVFRMGGSTPKLLQGVVNNRSVDSAWDGQGEFALSHMNARFLIWPVAHFTIGATGNADINVVAQALFENYGTLTVTMPANGVLSFIAPGWVRNFASMDVTSGAVAVRNFQNSGVIDLLTGDSRILLGRFGGSVVLDSSVSPSGQSVVRGPGLAIFEGAVTVSGGTAHVRNVRDIAPSVVGAGDLVVNGTYTWDPSSAGIPGRSSVWQGPGQTTIAATGKLEFKAEEFNLKRKLVNQGIMEWKNVWPGNLAEQSIKLDGAGTIENAVGGLFDIDGSPTVPQSIVRVGGTGALSNHGTVWIRPGLRFEMPAYNEGPTGRLRVMRPIPLGVRPVKIHEKLVFESSRIDVDLGAELILLGGLEQSGGEIVSSGGRVDVVGTFALSSGTSDYSGEFEGWSLRADTLTQTGGAIFAFDALIDVNGQFNQLGGTVELDQAMAEVGGWLIGQGAALYASRSGVIGSLSNLGLLELGLMNPPSMTYYADTFSVTGDFVQGSSGVLVMDVTNTPSHLVDQMSISGNAGFGGGFTLRAPPSFTSFPGQAINLITYGSRSGEFSGYTTPPGNWVPEYSDPPPGVGQFLLRRPYM